MSGAYIVCYLYGDMLEDFIFGDMGRWGGLWHNWAFFVHPFSLIASSYAMMHLEHGHEEHGAWRHPEMPMFDSIMETGKSPLHWPMATYDDNSNKLLSVIVVAILSYGIPTLYYQVMWKRSIRQSKSDIIASC